METVSQTWSLWTVSIHSRAIASNEREAASAWLAATAFRSAPGSTFAASSFLAWSALSRAAFSGVSGYVPKERRFELVPEKWTPRSLLV